MIEPPPLQHGVPSGARGVSSVTAADGPRTPFQFPTQSATVPRRVGPSPPNGSISQDSAFPPFPTSKPRSKTPTSPSAALQSFSFPKDEFQSHTAQEHSFAPLSPRDNGGGSILQRMDTIAPGPFQMSGKADFRLPGHRRKGTMSNSKDFTHQPIVGIGKGHFQRPSTSDSNETRKPSLSSISGVPRSALDRNESQAPKLPTATVPLVRSQTASMVSTESMLELDQPAHSIETLRQENRSKIYPLDDSDARQREEGAGIALRKASEPSLHLKKPSVSAASAIRPLHEIGSISSFKPSRSIKGRGQDHVTANTRERSSERTRRNEARNDDTLDDSPSVPMTTQPLEDHVGNSYHTPTESTASSGSTRSDTRSGSSTSTSPLSDSPQWERRRPSNTSQSGKLKTEFPFRTQSPPVGKENGSPQRAALPSFSRPMYGRPKNPPPSLEVGTLAPGTAGDPAIRSGRPFPTTTPDSYLGPSFSMQSGNLLLSPAPPSAAAAQSPTRKPKVSKGKCRGCQEPIYGKSVSSADGRLTGRYHKRCFVCTTCKQPFRTADFYILGNQPYCERHYHLLNGSMCMSCDHGIEGQYLETGLKQKFHPSCFTCQVSCR